MESFDEKLNRVLELLKKGEPVKMRKADGVSTIKDIKLRNNIVIIEFMDGDAIFLTRKQFMERQIITEKKNPEKEQEDDVNNMIKTMNEMANEGWKIYFKGIRINSLEKKDQWIVVKTENGMTYIKRRKDFLNSYKSARRD